MGLHQAELQGAVDTTERRGLMMENGIDDATDPQSPNIDLYLSTVLNRESTQAAIRPTTIYNAPTDQSNGTQSSASRTNRSDSLFSRHKSASTLPTHHGLEEPQDTQPPKIVVQSMEEDILSSVPATDGSDSNSSTDNEDYLIRWGALSNQFDDARNWSMPSRQELRKKRRDLVVIHQGEDPNLPIVAPAVPLSTFRKTIITILNLVILATIACTAYICSLPSAGTLHLRQTKRTLCISINIIALCAGIVTRAWKRSRREAVMTSAGVLLVGLALKKDMLEWIF